MPNKNTKVGEEVETPSGRGESSFSTFKNLSEEDISSTANRPLTQKDLDKFADVAPTTLEESCCLTIKTIGVHSFSCPMRNKEIIIGTDDAIYTWEDDFSAVWKKAMLSGLKSEPVKSFISSLLTKERLKIEGDMEAQTVDLLKQQRASIVEMLRDSNSWPRIEKGSKKYGGYKVAGVYFADMKRARAFKGGIEFALSDLIEKLK